MKADLCKENVANGPCDELEDVHGKVNASQDTILFDSKLESEKKLLEEENKLHVKEEDLKDKDKAREVQSETNASQGKDNSYKDTPTDFQDHVDVVHNTMKCMNDEKNDTSSKEKSLFCNKEEEDSREWSKQLQEKEKDLLDMKNSLHDLMEELNKQKETNRRLELKITNLNQDLKLQQKITVSKI